MARVLATGAQIRDAFSGYGDKFERGVMLGVSRVLAVIESNALGNIRRRRKHARQTGSGSTLAQSLSVNTTGIRYVKRRGGEVRGRIGTKVPYGIYLEFGTGLYGPKKRVIRPIRAKALAWETVTGVAMVPGISATGKPTKHRQRTKKVTFAAYVRGIRPWHWLSDAVKAAEPMTLEILRKAVGEVAS